MFFSVQLLGSKTPLGKLWMAAHQDRRLKRQDITDTSISKSVEYILHTETPLALRLSGMLLLGVVRIYSRQLVYLSSDCSDTLNKLNQHAQQTAAGPSTEGTIAARATVADVAAIMLPDDSELMCLHLAGDSDSFGLFDDDNASSSLAMAVEAHDSFMMIDDISGLLSSQVSMDEEHFMVSVEGEDHAEPEKLRAELSAERSLGNARADLKALAQGLQTPTKSDAATHKHAHGPLVSHDTVASERSHARADSVTGPPPGDRDLDDGAVPLPDFDMPFGEDLDAIPASPPEDAVDASFEPPPPLDDGGVSPAAKAATPAGDDQPPAAEPPQTGVAATATPLDSEYVPTPNDPTPETEVRKRSRAGAGARRVGPLRANRPPAKGTSMATIPRQEMTKLLADRSSLIKPLPPLALARAAPVAAEGSIDNIELHFNEIIKPTHYLNARTLDASVRVLLEASCSHKPIPQAAWCGEEAAVAAPPRAPGAKRTRAGALEGGTQEEDEIEDHDGATQGERGRPSVAETLGGATPLATPRSAEALRDAPGSARSAGGRAATLELTLATAAADAAQPDADAERDAIEAGGEHAEAAEMHDMQDMQDVVVDLPVYEEELGFPAPDGMDAVPLEDGIAPEVNGVPEDKAAGAAKRSAQRRRDEEAEEEALSEGAHDEGAGVLATASFTAHTKATLRAVQDLVKANAAAAKKRKVGAKGQPATEPIKLSHFTEGGSRMEAARHFYDMLVLQGKGYVELDQASAFADLHITPTNEVAP